MAAEPAQGPGSVAQFAHVGHAHCPGAQRTRFRGGVEDASTGIVRVEVEGEQGVELRVGEVVAEHDVARS